jgi:DTW domain-containing protein YfiP
VCELLPRVRFATPIVIVQHVRERFKPTNTARLFARMAPETVVLSYGLAHPPFDPTPLEDRSVEWHLLFPREGAPVLDPRKCPTADRRLGLVVLDGTWTQCARMSRRVPGVLGLPSFSLPDGPPSIWTVRTQRQANGLSTFEAALRAIELVEGSAVVLPVLQAFAWVTARVLRLKGKRPSFEVPEDHHAGRAAVDSGPEARSEGVHGAGPQTGGSSPPRRGILSPRPPGTPPQADPEPGSERRQDPAGNGRSSA